MSSTATDQPAPDGAARLRRQIEFVVETEKLKGVLRRTAPIREARRENAAEHSWSLGVMALVLAEHADADLDQLKVLRLLLVHDLVEIDAGDTFCFDETGNATRAEREAAAAERLFGLLPGPQAGEFRALWEEFESGASAEARFARALDRLLPVLQNFHNGGGTWREHRVTPGQAFERSRPIEAGSASLWRYAEDLLREAESRGHLRRDDP